MYKLKKELPKEFKIKVNPKQSEALQKHLFSIGVLWVGKLQEIHYTEMPYIYVENNLISYGFDKNNFKNYFKGLTTIKFKDYFEKVEEFPEKWCILVTEDNYQELNTWMHRNWKNYYKYKDNWTISKKDIKEYFHNDLFDAPLMSFKSSNSTLITTEQFRAKYGDLKSKDCVFTIDSALEVDPRKLPIFSENNAVLPLEIKRLQSENDKLKHQILMLTEKLETIKKVIE